MDNLKEVEKQSNNYGNTRSNYEDRRSGGRDYYDRNSEARHRYNNEYDRVGQRSGPYERERRPYRDPYDSDRRGYRNGRGSNDRSIGRYEQENAPGQHEDVANETKTTASQQEIIPGDEGGALKQVEVIETKTTGDANGDLNENYSGACGFKKSDVESNDKNKQVTNEVDNGTSEVNQADVCVS